MNILNWTLSGGVFHFTMLGYVIWTLVVTHITIVTVTLYLHRTVSHKALILNPFVEYFFRFWSWLTTGMNRREFGAIHRKHHAKVDTPEDPHSPIFYGLTSIKHFFVWVFYLGVKKYVDESHKKATLDKYGLGIEIDKLEKNLFAKHPFLGVGVLLGLINFFLLGLPGLLVWGVQALWIPVFATGIINGVGHQFGYTNYDKDDPKYPNVKYSTNISPIGILIGGEELHNNHHADAGSPFFARRWWEFDIGSVYIRLLCLFRLAKLRIPLVPTTTFQKNYYRIFGLS